MKTTYDLVRERIVELVSELKELKFGCEVSINGLKHKIYAEEEDHYSACTIFRGEWMDVDIGKDIINNPQRVIILGTEPQLHDVLNAIGGNHESDNTRIFLGVGEIEFDDPLRKKSCKWNLAQPLSGQSEPLLLFLKGLLQVENI